MSLMSLNVLCTEPRGNGSRQSRPAQRAPRPSPEEAPLYWILLCSLPRFIAASACAGAFGRGDRTVPLITATPSMRGGGARTDSNIYTYLQFGTSLGCIYRVRRIEILESSCEVPSIFGLPKSRAIISRTQALSSACHARSTNRYRLMLCC
jgi:hypothetical protein